MGLRPYQSECLSRIRQELGSHWSTLVVMATGLGKTHVFSHLAAEWDRGRVMIVAHREELIFHACRQAEAIYGSPPELEMGEYRAASGIFADAKIVCASVQTLSRSSRLERFDPFQFGLLVVDEAHHCVPTNKTYARVVEHFRQNPSLKLIGPTATPDRADELAMGQYFESVAYEYGILEGVRDGYLVPIEQRYVVVEGLDFSRVRTTAGDLNEKDLSDVMTSEKVLHRVVAPTLAEAGSEPTLIFASSVDHAHLICDIINRPDNRPGQAAALDGKTDKDIRRQKLKEFERGDFQFLVGCGLFLEGFDSPRISVVAMARPTKSRALYTQAIGRGTRLPNSAIGDLETVDKRLAAIAASSKRRLLVLDFVGNSGRHKLVSTADILAGRHEEAAVERAKERARTSGRSTNMAEAVEEAQQELYQEREEEERQRRLEQERRQREAEEAERRRRERVTARANYVAVNVDPFGGYEAMERSNGYGKEQLPTAKQAQFLRRHGINPATMTRKQAGEKITELIGRFQQGLCTPRQAAALERSGETATNCSRDKAGVLLDILKARGWERRDYELTRERWSIRRTDEGYAPVVSDTMAGKIVLSKRFGSESECRTFIAGVVEHWPAGGVA